MLSARRVPLRPDCPVKQGEEIEFTFEGRTLKGREGEPLAVSLLAAGIAVFGRSVKYHRPRGPYCLNGHCSGCLVRVDGVPNVRSCNVALRRGMTVERQKGWPSAEFDFLRAADLLSGKRIDHHGMFTSVGAVNRVVAKIVREMSGFGHLPSADSPAPRPVRHEQVEVAVVGAGAAGLAAALRMSERGQNVMLLERKRQVGGRLLDGSERLGEERTCWKLLAEFREQLDRADGVELHAGMEVVGAYPSPKGCMLVGVGENHTLVVEAERILFACGDYEQLPLFEGSDLPGIHGPRAFDRLFYLYGVVPAQPVLLYGASKRMVRMAVDLSEAGVEVAAMASGDAKQGETSTGFVCQLLPGYSPMAATGGRRLQRLELVDSAGVAGRLVDASLAVLEAPAAPAYELAHHAGCRVVFESTSGFRVSAGPNGATSQASLFAAGHCTGGMSVEEAVERGQSAADGLLESLAQRGG